MNDLAAPQIPWLALLATLEPLVFAGVCVLVVTVAAGVCRLCVACGSQPARALLAAAFVVLATGWPAAQSGNDLFQKALSKERVDGQLAEAIALYERVVNEAAGDRALVARALVQVGRCYERLGNPDAKRAYQRVVREFADQGASAAAARERLTALDDAMVSAPRGMTTRRIWSGRDVVLEGAPSLDGRYLTTIDRASEDLAIRDLATGQLRRLFAKPAGATGIEFAEASMPSPDGTRIVYQWFNSRNIYELRTIGLSDAAPRVLYSHPDTYVTPAGWSPDGKRVLAVIGIARTTQLAWIDVADRSVQVLKTLDWRWPNAARVSPDGRYIVYDFPPTDRAEHHDVFLLHADGSRETRLIEHPANDVHPIWAPDGRSVLFTSDRTGVNSLWMVRVVDGQAQGQPVLVKTDVGQSIPLGFTRNGAYYFGAYTGGSDVYVASLDPVTGAPSGDAAPISDRFVGANLSPEWSPDGRSLVYITRRGAAFGVSVDAGHLVVHSVATGEQRDLSTRLRRFYRPRWAPDGRTIVVAASDPQGVQGWYRLDVTKGEYERLRLNESEASIDEVEWAPDGRAVFYSARDESGSRLMRQSLDGGIAAPLYRAPAEALLRSLTVSPDGRHLAFRTMDPDAGVAVIDVLPVAGGTARELLRLAKGETIPGSSPGSSIVWTPQSDAVLFVKRIGTASDARNHVWRVPLATGRPQPIGVSMAGLANIRMRSDARALAFVAGERSADVWVMENFLPPPAASSSTGRAKGPR